MKRYLVKLLLVFLSLGYTTLSNEYSGLRIGDSVKVLDNSHDYNLRIYLFVDLSTCQICTSNIPIIYNLLKDYNVEFKIIIQKINQKDADDFKKAQKWNMNIISDEFGLYNAYYKILATPTIILLNNEGKVINFDKLGSSLITDEYLIDLCKSNDDAKHNITINEGLAEIKRLKVMKNDNPILSGLFERSTLYSPKLNQFYFRNNRSPELMILDSNANVIKTIDKISYPNLVSYNSYRGTSWVIEDSIIFLYDNLPNQKPIFYFYHINGDSLSSYKIIKIMTCEIRNRHSFETFFLTNRNCFLNFFCHGKGINEYLKSNDTTVFIYNLDGNVERGFDKPDSIYLEYRASKWFYENATYGNNNEILTIQNFTNKLKFWDKDFNLIKTQDIDFGDEFKKIDFDFGDNLDKSKLAELNNKISRTRYLLFDKITNKTLICYYNEYYAPGVMENNMEDMKISKYFVISDSNGKRLTAKPILVKPTSIPFFFNNSHIYCSELNQNKQLEIVVYKLTNEN